MPNYNKNHSNAKSRVYNGTYYRSIAEVQYAMFLDQRIRNKEIKEWEYENKIELFGENGTRVCNYKIDFTITNNDETTEFVEVKGFQTDIWRLKWKLFKDKYKNDKNYKITLIKA